MAVFSISEPERASRTIFSKLLGVRDEFCLFVCFCSRPYHRAGNLVNTKPVPAGLQTELWSTDK